MSIFTQQLQQKICKKSEICHLGSTGNWPGENNSVSHIPSIDWKARARIDGKPVTYKTSQIQPITFY